MDFTKRVSIIPSVSRMFQHILKHNDMDREEVYGILVAMINDVEPLYYKYKNDIKDLSKEDYVELLRILVNLPCSIHGAYMVDMLTRLPKEVGRSKQIDIEDYILTIVMVSGNYVEFNLKEWGGPL